MTAITNVAFENSYCSIWHICSSNWHPSNSINIFKYTPSHSNNMVHAPTHLHARSWALRSSNRFVAYPPSVREIYVLIVRVALLDDWSFWHFSAVSLQSERWPLWRVASRRWTVTKSDKFVCVPFQQFICLTLFLNFSVLFITCTRIYCT